MEELISTCRTCLVKDGKLLPLISLIESNYGIIDYFNKYLHINIFLNDNLPSKICVECLNKLLDVRKFFLQCKDSENYLKLKLQLPFKTAKLNIDLKSENENTLIQQDCEINLPGVTNKNLDNQIFRLSELDRISNKNKKEINEKYIDMEELIDEDLTNRKKLEVKIKEDSENGSIGSGKYIHYEILELETNEPKNQIENLMVENKLFQCQMCSEQFKYKSNLDFHKLLRHGNNEVARKIKDNLNNRLYKSTEHIQKMAIQCEICQHHFVYRSNYINHMRRHDQKIKYKNESCVCSLCGKNFKDKKFLQKHIYRHQKINKKIPCTICNKIFKAKYHLLIHMSQHTGKKLFKCKVCNKDFVSPSSLRLHKTLHDGKKIQCPMCDTKLAARTQLKIHMRMHTNERPYGCSQCTKRYKQLCSLKVHLATHSGVKSVKCEECSACFYSKNHLLSHKIKIHRPKRFHCNRCQRRFPTPFQMKNHLSSVHKIIVEDLSYYEVKNIQNEIQNSQK